MKLTLTFNTLSGRTEVTFDNGQQAFDATLANVWNYLSAEAGVQSVDFVYDGHMVNARLA